MRFDADLLRQCRFLAGPTASGKSAAALVIAESIGAEIVALDSMSLYSGMDIGTAKPDAADRQRVVHHLLDILEPHEEYSLADYVRAAERACREIVARGRVPLFVGGAGLYLRAILRGIFEGPPADWNLRRRLHHLAETEGEPALHAALARVDPQLAAKLHPHDVRRVIRGMEVFELTGIPLSVQQRQAPLPESERARHVDWLYPPRDWLYARIDARVAAMFSAGLVAEVERLLAAPRPMSRTARQALGYKEVIDYLEGRLTVEAVKALIQTRTRQFAKRQHTWFRNLEECRPVPIMGTESPAEIAQRLVTDP